MYKIMCDDDTEYTNIVFKTEEDAKFFIELNGESNPHLFIEKVHVFVRKFWYTLTPYVSWFNEHGEMSYIKRALPHYVFGMMDSQFSVVPGKCNKYVMIGFWNATKDIEEATTLAKSLYEGWKAGKNENV